MARFIFVHGTGVREESFQESFKLVTRGVRSLGNHHMVPCFWGDELGSFLRADGLSIPDVRNADQAPTATDDTAAVQTWALLDTDPWILVKAEINEASDEKIETRSPPDLVAIFENAFSEVIKSHNTFTTLVNETPMTKEVKAARDEMFDNPLFNEFSSSLTIDAGDKLLQLSRTFIAILLARSDSRRETPIGLSGDHRQALENSLLNALGGQTRSMSGRLAKVTSRLLSPFVLPLVERQRAEITKRGTSTAGDVLKYFARPQKFHEKFLSVIDESEEPTVVLGHSLGAIIAFSALCNDLRPHVDRLITVGTQIGFLYELDALPGLAFDEKLPRAFPAWDNIYDPRDFLAYKTQGLFGSKSMDHEIDNRSPFPRCHESYFDNDSFYDLLKQIL